VVVGDVTKVGGQGFFPLLPFVGKG
jgi:hypothetical protein